MPAQSGYEIWIIPAQDVSVQHEVEDGLVVLRGPINAFVEGETIPYLAYGLLELAGAEQGQLTMHGAVVYKDGRCIALLGKEGFGKTSVALALCTKYGFELLANDLFVVGLAEGETQALAGTRHFFIRGAVVMASFPELSHLIMDKVTPGQSLWNFRCSLTPQSVGVNVESGLHTIDEAYIVQVISGEDLTASKPTHTWACLYLHENLTRYLRKVSLPTVVSWSETLMLYNPSYDKERFHGLRLGIIQDLLKRAHLTTFCGDLSYVVQAIIARVA